MKKSCKVETYIAPQKVSNLGPPLWCMHRKSFTASTATPKSVEPPMHRELSRQITLNSHNPDRKTAYMGKKNERITKCTGGVKKRVQKRRHQMVLVSGCRARRDLYNIVTLSLFPSDSTTSTRSEFQQSVVTRSKQKAGKWVQKKKENPG